MSKLDNAFVLVCLNRFQQIITVHTFQTESEQIKVKIIDIFRFKLFKLLYLESMHNGFLDTKIKLFLQLTWISKLREAQEVWKKTLQTTVFKDEKIGGTASRPLNSTSILVSADNCATTSYGGILNTQSPTD